MAACVTPVPAPDVSPVERPAERAEPTDASVRADAPADSGAKAGEADAAPPAPAAEDAGAVVELTGAGAPIAAPATLAADNKVEAPLEAEDLTQRAKELFEGIVKNEPSLGDPFWFPREPFIPLKDVKDPGKYWDNLHRAYHNDIKALHRKRKGVNGAWEGAQFKGFEVGSRPKWVPPGDEANKIGYYRSFHGKLKYEIDGKAASIDVHTIISWQGRWYVTHLSKFKK